MVEYIPVGIFRSWRGGKRDERFQCTLICKNLYKLCSFKILKIGGPLSKMTSCTRRVPKIGRKKTLEKIVKKF
jgi:hypothetical protein